jgi:hypothetical protein
LAEGCKMELYLSFKQWGIIEFLWAEIVDFIFALPGNITPSCKSWHLHKSPYTIQLYLHRDLLQNSQKEV